MADIHPAQGTIVSCHRATWHIVVERTDDTSQAYQGFYVVGNGVIESASVPLCPVNSGAHVRQLTHPRSDSKPDSTELIRVYCDISSAMLRISWIESSADSAPSSISSKSTWNCAYSGIITHDQIGKFTSTGVNIEDVGQSSFEL